MGELILCKQPIAAVPFYMERASVNLYSLEELSYFIYHHVYQIQHDFMSVELCRWIGKECQDPSLEQQLMEMLKENVPLHIFVGHILSHIGYLTMGEIKETLATIQAFENKSDVECQKIYADQLMDEKAYAGAIRVYEQILDQDRAVNQSLLFMGDVWHNLGTAYARLFFFQEAARCYEKAYQKNRRDATLKALIMAVSFDEDEEALKDVMKRFSVPPQFVQAVQEEMHRAKEQKSIRLFAQSMDMQRLSTDYYQKEEISLNGILEGWEKDYLDFAARE